MDEVARFMTDAADAAKGVSEELEAVFRTQVERVVNRLELVRREEFEALKEMAARESTDYETLVKRIEALETRLKVSGETASLENDKLSPSGEMQAQISDDTSSEQAEIK